MYKENKMKLTIQSGPAPAKKTAKNRVRDVLAETLDQMLVNHWVKISKTNRLAKKYSGNYNCPATNLVARYKKELGSQVDYTCYRDTNDDLIIQRTR